MTIDEQIEQITIKQLRENILTYKKYIAICEAIIVVKHEQAIRWFWKRNATLELQAYVESRGIIATPSEISVCMTKMIQKGVMIEV